MNRLLKSILAGSIVAAGFMGCGLLDATENKAPTITVDAIGSINVGTFKNVEGKVEAAEAITSLSYAITDANGTAVTTITVSGPSSSSEKTMNFKDNNAIKITVTNAAVAKAYKLKITATAGSTAEASFDFTVSGSAATTLTEKTNGFIANVTGPDTGAFNLVDGTRIPSAGAASSKDLLDLSIAGSGFAGKLGSGNNSTFVTASATDYTGATDVSVKALAATATLTEVTVSTVGTVFAVKLGSSRGCAIVKITSYDATAGASTGANKGEVKFSYKFTAN